MSPGPCGKPHRLETPLADDAMSRALLQPSNLILLTANLVPLIGVILWDWDAFVLLMLYWLETAIIAFWTIVRIATLPISALGDIKFSGSDRTPSPLGLALFFTLHAGIFMGVHFMFLWTLFAGAWARRIGGPGSFVDQMVIGTGLWLWLPLAVLFVVRGLLMAFDAIRPWLMRRLRITPRAPLQGRVTLGPGESLLFGLYIRIIIMQVTIIIGAFFALLVGSVGALVLLVAIKTAVDLAFQVLADRFHAAMREAKAKSSAGS
jgi:Family of unknown function (DUF6498)